MLVARPATQAPDTEHSVEQSTPTLSIKVMTVNIHKGFTFFNRKFILHELRDAMRLADADDAVRVIVLTGAGRGFCAGADMALLGPDGTETGVADFAGYPLRLQTLGLPVALALLVAESDPAQKDVLIRLIVNMLAQGGRP